MNKIYFLISFFLISQRVFATGENLVKTESVSISGYSSIESDLSTIYGGIAVATCTGDGSSTCNSCTTTTTLSPCNQKSVYPGLQLTISFQVTKDVTNSKAQLFVLNSSTNAIIGSALDTVAATSYTAGSSTISLTTNWGKICEAAGIGTGCATPATSTPYSLKLGFGVGSTNDGADVNTTNEIKTVNLKLHYMASGDATVSQAYCPTTAAGAGVCNIVFKPGDEKVYIDSAITNGADSASSIDWDAVAIFPVAVTSDGSQDAAAFTNFTSNAVAPLFAGINTDGTIPDSKISGGLTNYQRYCFVYANRNKAQNIYRFVAGASSGVDTATACVVPSEVVGLLEDKHCFISTAAFGSQMAPEVDTFRKFRNKFLLTNSLGRQFVHVYYKLSPPVAAFISSSEVLKSMTRGLLYPLLGFSYLALNYGFLVALLTAMVLLILISNIAKIFKSKKVLIVLFILFLTPFLKAQIIPPDTQVIQHPDARDGLTKIKKDGSYVYDIKRKMKNQSSRINFGQANNPEITIDITQLDASGNETGKKTFNFDDFYGDSSKFIIGYDYEYYPWLDKGKLGLQAGFSMMYASGHGRLKASPSPASEERFSFFTIPLNLGGVYRLEWKDKQIIAPYVAGGGTLLALIEKREDKSMPHYTAAPGFFASAGTLINLGFLDGASGFALESEYGISNLWLSLEFKVVEVNADAFSFSNQYFNAGFSFDF